MKNPIITKKDEAVLNILRFENSLKENSGGDLLKIISYVRAWYAVKDKNGSWIFGPSKFIGYKNLEPNEYIETAGQLDGRVTERQLQNWFSEVTPSNEFYAELNQTLSEKLSRWGKAPSSMFRINIENENFVKEPQENGYSSGKDDLTKLLIAVIKTLNRENQKIVRDSIPK